MPALSFLMLLALVVLLLPDEQLPPPLPVETTASDIVWSRMTAAGETIRLRAHHLQRRSDGVVVVEEVEISTRQQKNNLRLRGKQGRTDTTYRQIRLAEANGELITAAGARVTLSLAAALYSLDGSHLQGEQVKIHQTDGNLSGDIFLWDDENMVLRGNVRATYLPPQTP